MIGAYWDDEIAERDSIEMCGYTKDAHAATVELEWPRLSSSSSMLGHGRPNVFACDVHARDYESFGYRRAGAATKRAFKGIGIK